MKYWAEDDRPREKMFTKGVSALSNSELLAILLNTGNRDNSVLELAQAMLTKASNNLSELGKLSLGDLRTIKGIGRSKAAIIFSALELGRRRQAAASLDKPVIRKSQDIALYLQTTLKDLTYEVFSVIFLNRANKINHFEIISRGGITGTVADPRVIMKKALEENATSLVLAHNHPSGNLQPSSADEELTRKIKGAASYFDIKVIDHIIVSDDGYYSFADEGII